MGARKERSRGMAERVWDRFLTEQDKAHLAALSRDRRVGFGTRPALLFIDLYRWVFGDEPQELLEGVKQWPGHCGVPGWHESAHRDAPRPATVDPAMADRVRRQFDIVDEVAPLPGEVVLRKTSPSAFWGTPLAGHLNYLDVDTLLVCGESTSGCVRASVVDGCTYRYRMIVVEEGVFDRHEACHAINLFDMHQKYADVVPLAEALDYLRRWQAERAPAPALAGAR